MALSKMIAFVPQSPTRHTVILRRLSKLTKLPKIVENRWGSVVLGRLISKVQVEAA